MDHDQLVARLKDGKFEVLGNYQALFLNLLKADASVVLGSAGETDEVVTIDARRQIRWPTSLHGKSGMRVSEFPLSRLDPDGHDPYNPLNEALFWVLIKPLRWNGSWTMLSHSLATADWKVPSVANSSP